MYLLKPDGSDRLIQAWCEHGLDNGGWTVLQRRRDGSVNFFRNWENYKVTASFNQQLDDAFPHLSVQSILCTCVLLSGIYCTDKSDLRDL